MYLVAKGPCRGDDREVAGKGEEPDRLLSGGQGTQHPTAQLLRTLGLPYSTLCGALPRVDELSGLTAWCHPIAPTAPLPNLARLAFRL